MKKQDTTPRCSFCGKTEAEVKKFIERINKDSAHYKPGPRPATVEPLPPIVRICDECVELCTDFIEEVKKLKTAPVEKETQELSSQVGMQPILS